MSKRWYIRTLPPNQFESRSQSVDTTAALQQPKHISLDLTIIMSATTLPLKSEHLPPHSLTPSETNNEKGSGSISPIPIDCVSPAITPNATNTNTNADTTTKSILPSITPLLQSKIHDYLCTLPAFGSLPRMRSLYSDLGRQKASNPSGFEANLGWWRGVIVDLVSNGLLSSSSSSSSLYGRGGHAAVDGTHALVLRVDQELSDALWVEKVGRPAGLGTIVVSTCFFSL